MPGINKHRTTSCKWWALSRLTGKATWYNNPSSITKSAHFPPVSPEATRSKRSPTSGSVCCNFRRAVTSEESNVRLRADSPEALLGLASSWLSIPAGSPTTRESTPQKLALASESSGTPACRTKEPLPQEAPRALQEAGAAASSSAGDPWMRETKSAFIRLPSWYWILQLNSLMRMPHRWMRAFFISAVKRDFSGLWSVKIVHSAPSKYWRNFFRAVTTAQASYSIVAHLHWVRVNCWER